MERDGIKLEFNRIPKTPSVSIKNSLSNNVFLYLTNTIAKSASCFQNRPSKEQIISLSHLKHLFSRHLLRIHLRLLPQRDLALRTAQSADTSVRGDPSERDWPLLHLCSGGQGWPALRVDQVWVGFPRLREVGHGAEHSRVIQVSKEHTKSNTYVGADLDCKVVEELGE